MKKAEARIRKLKRDILAAAARAGEGHIASAFSVLDLLWVLYDGVMRIHPERPDDGGRDRFILSKGHAALGLYAVLLEKGFWPGERLEDFGGPASPFGGHPHRLSLPGIEASTGSLGHGFPMAVGLALGLRIRNHPARVFVLIGDGEANEGTVWESALLAAHHRLDNLVLIVDDNRSSDRALGMGDLQKKFAAFGWRACTIDGHDHAAIRKALDRRCAGAPAAVVARTVKGRGIREMENEPAWHHRAPSPLELPRFLEELA
jgi:transketolase